MSLLDPSNSIDFIPKINYHLEICKPGSFTKCWQTPLQLLIQGWHVNAQEMFGDGEVHVWLERLLLYMWSEEIVNSS